LLSGGGPFVFLSTLHVAALFPNKSAFIMALLNGSFSAGALLFLVFNTLYNQYNISLQILFIAYGVIIGLISITSFFLWPWSKFSEKTGVIEVVPDEPAQQHAKLEEHPLFEKNGGLTIQHDGLASNEATSYWVTLKKNALNWHFLWLVLYIPVMISMGNFYLGTANYQLALITSDSDEINQYAGIFAILLPVLGIVAAPIGLLIDRFGINSGIFFFVTLAAICHAIGIVRNLQLQIVRFIGFSIFYPYTYTLWSDFIFKKFGFINYGMLFAAVALMSGILSFATTALVDYAVASNQYDWINIGWIGCVLAGLIYPVVILVIRMLKYEPSTNV